MQHNNPSTSAGPLAGIRVLDICHFLAGPYATLILGDLGADVIKIEDPDHADEARALGPYFQDGQSLYFASLNWGKRSLGARLSRSDGREVILDLVRNADAVVDNFRPGVMEKLGLTHETLASLNPRIITCSLTGYGETGPYATRPGYDYTIQAAAGVMSLTGEPDGPPGKAGISYVDHGGGLAAALAVCAAVIERSRTGLGRHLDLSLFDVQMSMLTYLASWQLNVGFEPERTPNGSHPSLVPAQTFETRDGFLSVFVGNDPMFVRLVAALEEGRLADPAFATTDGRLVHRAALVGIVQENLKTKDSAEWVRILSTAGVPCAPVNSIGEALEDPHVAARGLVGTAVHPSYASYEHVRGPLPMVGRVGYDAGAPLLGEHTRDLLVEMGYGPERIASLIQSGAVFTT